MIINHTDKTIIIESAIDLVPAINYLEKVVPIKERQKWRVNEPKRPRMINVSSRTFKRLYEPAKGQETDVTNTTQE